MSSADRLPTKTNFRKTRTSPSKISSPRRRVTLIACGTQLVLGARERFVSRRLHQLIAVWFVLQIVLPFTAPLQTLDLHDLFGGATHSQSSSSSPESSTTPTLRDTSGASAIGSLVGPAALRLCTTVVVLCDITLGPAVAQFSVPSADPSVQHAVLRV
jgi:hypothetical protein